MGSAPPPDLLAELVDVRYRYAAGIDLLDWDLYRSIFCEEIEVAMMAVADRAPPRAATTSADGWVERVKGLVPGLAATQHSMFNPRAEVRGHDVVLQTYMQAEHFLDFESDDGWYSIGGYYTDGFRQTSVGWRIASLRLTLFWHRGNPKVLPRAERRVAAGKIPVRPASTRPTHFL